jgi:enoyl-CoA hydratase/carnithine racemase
VSELTRLESRSGIDYLTLSSPENRNALSTRLIEELLEGLAISRGRALVIQHDSDVFCAGVDLRERSSEGADQVRQSSLLVQLMRALLEVPQPLICRIDGPVRGGGMGFVACADIVVASPSASFAFSEVRVGVVPAIVGGLALVKLPAGPLAPLLLSGIPFSSDEALRVGLVHNVDDDTSSVVSSYCTAISAGGPGAVAATKALVRRLTQPHSTIELLDDLEARSAQHFASDEAAEGMAAFLERRSPVWASAEGDK